MRRRSRADFFDRWEKPLLYLAVGCIVVLLVSQALMIKENPRHFLSWVDRLEGEPVSLQTPSIAGNPVTVRDNSPVTNPLQRLREHKNLVIRMLKPAKQSLVYVTVNGVRSGDFRWGEVMLEVYEGDYVEIDAGQLEEPGQFIVKTEGAGFLAPIDGLLLEGKEGAIPVGKVKFKR